MYGVVDYREAHEATTGEYPRLLALARQLTGERVLMARRGYPDEIKLHMGVELCQPAPQGQTMPRGSYVLNAVASAWSFKITKIGLCLSDEILELSTDGFPSLSEDDLDKLLTSVGGQTVTRVEVERTSLGYGIALNLSDGSVLSIVPTPPENIENAGGAALVPDWELFTPYGRYLRVGPGASWAYLSSDSV